MDIAGLKGKVLLFNIGSDKKERIALLCSVYGAVPVTVTPSDHNKELGELVGFHKGIDDEKRDASESFTDEMMIFSMVADLEGFLDDYKRMGIPPIPLKAVLTATNMKWTAAELHSELAKEHEALKKKV